MLEKVLRFLVGKKLVTNRTIEYAERTLVEILAEKGFAHADRIPGFVRTVLVQEAARRASEVRRDGHAQMNHFLDEIDAVADAIISAFNGDEHADPRIKSLLVFHKVLE